MGGKQMSRMRKGRDCFESDSQVFAEARDALTEIHTQQKWPEWTDGTDDPRR